MTKAFPLRLKTYKGKGLFGRDLHGQPPKQIVLRSGAYLEHSRHSTKLFAEREIRKLKKKGYRVRLYQMLPIKGYIIYAKKGFRP